MTLKETVAQAERTAIVYALLTNELALMETAKSLGISRKTLWEKMRKYGIRRAALKEYNHDQT